jgi:hypothetical protein
VHYINDHLNVETLAENPEEAINNTVEKIIAFIEETKDILIPLPK